MAGDGRLRKGQDVDHVADAELTNGEQVEDPQACRVGDALEARIDAREPGIDDAVWRLALREGAADAA